jgi:Family of unknown function (DUF6165)
LQIKFDRLNGPARRNVAKELALLNETKSDAPLNSPDVAALMVELKAVNAALWDIEDQIRELEARGDFGPSFIETARSVYKMNDWRAAIKAQSNIVSGSDVVEEKSYRKAITRPARTLGSGRAEATSAAT